MQGICNSPDGMFCRGAFLRIDLEIIDSFCTILEVLLVMDLFH